MNEKIKMLILGSDYSTIEVVKEAHRKGIYVITTDLMKRSPTKDVSDESWLISTTDIDVLEKKCRENNVNAIMFGASDFNINNARILCKRLQLPIYCKSDKAWEVARNKEKFKELCKKHNVPIAKDYIITDELSDSELRDIAYPVVVKPCDKSGNRGMSFCSNKVELINGYKKAREVTDNTIIVERQLHGKEYNIHYVVANGECTLLYFNSTHHEPGFDSNLYSFKCTNSEYFEQYLSEVDLPLKKVFKDAEVTDGIVWVDAIRDDDGHFYLLEMGHRFGGVMTYVPYFKVTGFSVISWMIECSIGINHSSDDLPKFNFPYISVAGSYHLFTLNEGVVSKIDGLEQIEKLENVYVDMPKREGDSVRKKACIGLIGIYGKDIDDLCNTINKINSLLKIKDSNNQDMIIYYDDYAELKREYHAGLNQF